jgi:hypothetical protein
MHRISDLRSPIATLTSIFSVFLAVLFKRAISIRHCAVHRRPQIPVKKLEEIVRDAWLLSQALQDDSRQPLGHLGE